MALSGYSWWDLNTAQAMWLATHNSLLLYILSLHFHLFILFKLLHFTFSPICPPHTRTLWWLLLQAGHMAGGSLGDIL